MKYEIGMKIFFPDDMVVGEIRSITDPNAPPNLVRGLNDHDHVVIYWEDNIWTYTPNNHDYTRGFIVISSEQQLLAIRLKYADKF
jgi:hypothetical protein